MIGKRDILTALFAAVLLAGCATGPKYDTSAIDLSITPQQAVVESEALQGAQVLWGGIIIASANLKEVTQFEILAYPLDSSQKPLVDKTALGRFFAQQVDYLETSDYTQGRLITVNGILQDKKTGRIGDSEYTYPLVNINQHYLWPRQNDTSDASIRFGIGVMIHN